VILRRAAFDGGVGLQRAFVRGGNGHALGAVDGRAAAHGDQAVAALRVVDRHGGAHGGFGGVGGGLVIHGHGQAGQGVQRLLQDAGGLDAGVGHDQRAADAHALALGGQQVDGAKVDLDLGQVVDECHGCLRVALYDASFALYRQTRLR
jgi:hypothetical protein